MPFDPASRYDPASMGRIADDDIDPEAELFDHADNGANHSLGGGAGGSASSGLDLAPVRRRGAGAAGLSRGALCGLVAATALVGLWVAGIARAAWGGGGGGSGSSPPAPPASSPSGGGDGGAAADASKAASQFVPPPDDLATRCSPLAVSTREGWDACQSLCASAECCFLEEGHWFSCAADREEDCSAYEYGCQTLDHVEGLRGKTKEKRTEAGGDDGETNEAERVTVPDAPEDLADLCAVENLADPEGHAKCKTACDAAGCCVEDDDVCVAANPAACDAYADPCPALTGKAMPAANPDAVSSQVMVKCNTQSLLADEGVRECQALCDGASCCFDEGGGGGCAGPGADDWCEQFGPCQGLLQLGGPGRADEPPPSIAAMAEGGDAVSAFADGDAAKAAVDGACGTDYRSCVNVCRPAGCCFGDNDGGASSCAEAGLDGLECGHYESCAILFETTVLSDGSVPGEAERIQLAEAPSDLAELCSASDENREDADDNSEEAVKCAAFCRDSHCCAEAVEHCVVANADVCADYVGPCGTRWDGMAEEASVPAAPLDLAERCADRWSGDCLDACRGAECCALPDTECQVLDQEQCKGFEASCQPLWDAFRLDEGPSNVLAAKCEGGATSDGCREGCGPAACCSEAYGCDLAVANKGVCEEYREAGCGDAWESLAADSSTNSR